MQTLDGSVKRGKRMGKVSQKGLDVSETPSSLLLSVTNSCKRDNYRPGEIRVHIPSKTWCTPSRLPSVMQVYLQGLHHTTVAMTDQFDPAKRAPMSPNNPLWAQRQSPQKANLNGGKKRPPQDTWLCGITAYTCCAAPPQQASASTRRFAMVRCSKKGETNYRVFCQKPACLWGDLFREPRKPTHRAIPVVFRYIGICICITKTKQVESDSDMTNGVNSY